MDIAQRLCLFLLRFHLINIIGLIGIGILIDHGGANGGAFFVSIALLWLMFAASSYGAARSGWRA
jgi:hypothetical protein